jgi:hypothetical protein
VEFSPELRERVLAGDITVSFRLWRRAKVKVGGRYRVGHGQIEVESVDVVPFGAITAADVRHAGEKNREMLGSGRPTRAPSPTTRCCSGSGFAPSDFDLRECPSTKVTECRGERCSEEQRIHGRTNDPGFARGHL